ncbi:MFS transporter [Enterobacter sp. R1(2018)]|uniref:MFS transporter n=1 Tax=Enterobacter sp. R1(2018) TaxID=2447891 RepID=UPI000EAF3E99|nr:MFS transporter [Enterobacter sp. R1(2018)]RKQ39643.1 MFS transporter [Enterobacter sp. R1(2018)]
MFFLILHCLRKYRWFALLGGARLLSSVGNGLTYVIVFGKLLTLAAKPSSLTLAYILALAPGIPGSMLAEKLLKRMPLIPIVILSELLGLGGLVFPLCSLYSDNHILLLLSQAVVAFAGGMMVPVLSQLLKNGLQPAELAAASGLETLIFAANVILGIGIGTLLYGRLPAAALLALDALSFVFAIVLLFAAHRTYKTVGRQENAQVSGRLRWRELNELQRRSLLLLPALALVGAPAMALLPALAPHFSGEVTDTGLMLLLARSFGQLIGPLLLSEAQLARQSGKLHAPVFFLALFICCYVLVSVTHSQGLAMLLIVAAHIFTNIVYVLATLNIMRTFPAVLTGTAMAKSWRLQLAITMVLPVIAGFAADSYDPAWVLYLCSGSGLVSVIMMLTVNHFLRRGRDRDLNSEENG